MSSLKIKGIKGLKRNTTGGGKKQSGEMGAGTGIKEAHEIRMFIRL